MKNFESCRIHLGSALKFVDLKLSSGRSDNWQLTYRYHGRDNGSVSRPKRPLT
jgi:hypothetical protein